MSSHYEQSQLTSLLAPNWQKKKGINWKMKDTNIIMDMTAVFSPLSISLLSPAGHIMMLSWLHFSPVKMGRTHSKLV